MCKNKNSNISTSVKIIYKTKTMNKGLKKYYYVFPLRALSESNEHHVCNFWCFTS